MNNWIKYLLIILIVSILLIIVWVLAGFLEAIVGLILAIVALALTQLSNLIGFDLIWKEKPLDYSYTLKKVSDISPKEFGVFHYNPHYILRKEDEEISILLKSLNVVEHVLLITGKPGSGKTRAAYQIIKEKGDFKIIWFMDKSIQIDKIPDEVFKGKIIVFFNDLNNFVKKFDSYNFSILIDKLKEKSKESYIIGTCRSGPEYESVIDEYSPSIDFEIIELGDISESTGKELAKELNILFDQDKFDGTPGSVVLNIRGMQKRYKQLSNDSRVIFRILKLFYESGTISLPSHILKDAYIKEVTEQNVDHSRFENALTELENSSFVRIKKWKGEIFITVTHRTYFDFENILFSNIDFQWLQNFLTEKTNSELLFNLGISFFLKNEYLNAIESFDRALEINPNNFGAWTNRGAALSDLGKYDDAIICYDRALEINPNNFGAWTNRGAALLNLGRYDDAIVSFDRALEINPHDFLAYYNKGNTLSDLGRYDDAIVSFDRALEINPNNFEAWSNRATVLFDLGRYDDAIVSFNNAIKINPEDPSIYFNRGNVLIVMGKYDDAIMSFDRALEINPKDFKAWDQMAIALVGLGKYEEAVDSFDNALKINQNDPLALNNRKAALKILEDKSNEL